MHRRLEEWFDTHGRRLAELKIAGGEEFFVDGNKDLRKLNNLTGAEWIEFFSLIGELDGLVMAFLPTDEAKAQRFQSNIAKRMDEIEKYCRLVYKITGRICILRTSA